MTILAAGHGERYLIVELGSSGPGEIARLAAIVEPDIAVITSVGRSHLERFGSVEAVAREKASLIAHQRTTGIGFVNADAPALPRRWPGGPTVVRFGEHEDADLRLTARGPRKDGGWWFEVNGRTRFDLALPGRHNAINALAAVGIGRRFGLSDEAMSAALGTVRPEPMRMSREVVGGGAGIELYNDAYNANPDSMAAALETFVEAAAAAPRRVVVLGDMLELGAEAPALHRELGRAVVDADSRCTIAHVVIVGAFAADVAGEIRRVWPASRVTVRRRLDAAAIRAASRRVQPGDAVLVKASRGVGLERLVAALQGAGGD